MISSGGLHSLLLFFLALCACHGWAPVPTSKNRQCAAAKSRQAKTSLFMSKRDNMDDVANKGNDIPLLLPGSGQSSLASSIVNGMMSPTPTSSESPTAQPPEPVPYATNRKFQLQYTCCVCETRNFHRVSRAAYRKGVVIAECKGCKSQHLIADYLGFTNMWNKDEYGNIEEFFSQSEKNEEVSRVSVEVFDLERTLSHDTSSGSLVSDDGELSLE